MFLRRLAAIACCCLISLLALSQKKDPKLKFGDIKPDDFKPEYYSIDSSADAVYLTDVGSSHHEGNNKGWFSVVYNVHKRIRLMHKKSFDDLSTVHIYLYASGQDKEKLDDLQAATYNIENGNVVQTKVEKSAIFQEKDGDFQVVKFNFPNIKEGSIVEYTYKTTSPYFRYIPTWTFQGAYPRLWSQFSIEEPQFFDFVVLKQGYLTPAIDTAIISADNFNILEPNDFGPSRTFNVRSNTIKHTWAFKDIPAIKEESYITTLSNYVQKLEFQFSAIRFPNEAPQTYLSTWYETVDQLMKNEDFGVDLNKGNGWLKDDVKSAVIGETDPLKKAKNIYAFVRSNYTCTDNTAIYLSQTLKKTQQSRKGNVADINMLLTAMLKESGYEANPVLLSTREHGKPYDAYPILSKFNYLIAQVMIDNKQYLLDASDASLGFNRLPEYCYNGDARLIAPQPYIIDLSPDSLHESEVTSFFITNGDNGKLNGTYKHIMNNIQSIEMRSKMKKTNTEEYFKEVQKGLPFEVELGNKIIDSLSQPEMPVSVQYDLSFKTDEDVIYFTPIIADGAYKQNPFKAAQRNYPVEMPYCMDETYILNMEVPSGYTVDELPKASRVSLNDGEGSFEYLIQHSGNNIQLRCRTKLNKATFEPEDYETLRNFFGYVVQKQSEQIVFKKM